MSTRPTLLNNAQKTVRRRDLLGMLAILPGLGALSGLVAACAPTAPAAPTAAPPPAGANQTVPTAASNVVASTNRTYRLWTWKPQDNYQAWFKYTSDEFAKKYPGSSFEIVPQSGDSYAPALKTSAIGGQAPDIAMASPASSTIEIWKSGLCLDLTPFYQQDKQWQDLTDLWGTVPDVMKSYENGLYAATAATNTVVFWWWKDLLADLGATIPETMDDVFALVPKAKSKNMSVLASGFGPGSGSNAVDFYFMLEGLFDPTGQKLWDASHTGKGDWNQPELKGSLELWARMLKEQVFDPGVMEEEYGSGTNSGKNLFRDKHVLGLYQSGPWMIGYPFADQANNLKQIGLGLPPKLNPADPWSRSGSHDVALQVFVVNDYQKSAEHQRMMVDWLKIANGAPSQELAFRSGLLPAWSGAVNQPVQSTEMQLVKDHIELDKAVTPDHVHNRSPFNADMEAALVDQLQTLALGKGSVDVAVSTLEATRKRVFGA